MKGKKKYGFTLVELMASLAIFIILTVAMVSMLTLAIKHNSINKQRYESDLNCKAVIEMMKHNSNRPQNKGNRNGNYYVAFDTEGELKDFVDKYVKTENASILQSIGSISDLNSAMETVKNSTTPSKKYGIILKSEWKNETKLYDIELWSWDIKKGRSSLINRKLLLRPSSDPRT